MSSAVGYIDPNVQALPQKQTQEVLEQVQPTMVLRELQQVSKDQMKQCKLGYSHHNIAILTQLLQYSNENVDISLVKKPRTSP